MRRNIWRQAIWSVALAPLLLVGVLAPADVLGDEKETAGKPQATSGDQAAAQESKGDQTNRGSDEEAVRHHAKLGVLLSKSDDGVHVVGIIPGSAADRADLRVGDEIRYVGDERVRTIQGLTEEIRKYKPAAQIDLSIRRNGERQIVKARLGSDASAKDKGARDRSTAEAQQNARAAQRGERQAKRGRESDARTPNDDPANDPQQASRQIQSLQRQISRLQRRIDELQRNQNSRMSQDRDTKNSDRGWNGSETMDDDPSLFQ